MHSDGHVQIVFLSHRSFFDSITHSKLDLQRDGLWLYRHMIPPRVPNLAFVGSEVRAGLRKRLSCCSTVGLVAPMRRVSQKGGVSLISCRVQGFRVDMHP